MLADLFDCLPGILVAVLVLILFGWRVIDSRDDPPPPVPGWPPKL